VYSSFSTPVIKYIDDMPMNRGYWTVQIAQIFGVGEETLFSLLEVGPAPTPEEATTWEIRVERIGQRKYSFHCRCGAAVVTSNRAVTCTNCGKTFGIRRVKHTQWHIAPRWGVQSLLQLAIYAAVSAL
jgi:hypothetical protein